MIGLSNIAPVTDFTPVYQLWCHKHDTSVKHITLGNAGAQFIPG